MCKWMVDHFDSKTHILDIHGKQTIITTMHVEWLLGFKSVGFDIESKMLDEDYEERFMGLANIDVDSMAMNLRKLDHEDKLFKALFTLFMMTALLSPTPDRKPKEGWLHVKVNAKMILLQNYAKFMSMKRLNFKPIHLVQMLVVVSCSGW